MYKPKAIEICAGGGGQAIGLESAGFELVALVEIDKNACATLQTNRPNWNVVERNLTDFSATSFEGIDLLAGGVPCSPFTIAGKQLGSSDERDLIPEAIRLFRECRPKALMLENVKGLLDAEFSEYRQGLAKEIENSGYVGYWKLLNACDFGVPQLRPRVVFVAIRKEFSDKFTWSNLSLEKPLTVGEVLYQEMSSNGWLKVEEWKRQANQIAPTLVGGSKKHGGPDLGPTRAKKAWEKLGVDAKGLANEPPPPYYDKMPRLTVRMTATLQGFPDEWEFWGGKTSAYRQIGNAFPPPVAKAVGEVIVSAIT
jgi:DNA (cytosine-5)-methyltransferase 1